VRAAADSILDGNSGNQANSGTEVGHARKS
jgi:hypothetical protein